VALERGGRRATLEAGGMRVTVDTDDLVPADGAGSGDRGGDRTATATGTAATNVTELRLDRARSVASSLDLRGARVDEALDALSRYLDDAGLAGLDKVLIIHGMGTGALRDAVRSAATDHPLVKSVRAGQRGEGGDGATIVEF
jgi:DNA mismatch repair protein MutS2